MLISESFEGGEHLGGIASLEKNGYALFEGIRKGAQGWKMTMIRMFVRYPDVVDTIKKSGI